MKKAIETELGTTVRIRVRFSEVDSTYINNPLFFEQWKKENGTESKNRK